MIGIEGRRSICFRCGNEGHFGRTCTTFSGSEFCSKYKRYGHTANRCQTGGGGKVLNVSRVGAVAGQDNLNSWSSAGGDHGADDVPNQ